MAESIFITHTKRWIADVVIGSNFCPFASKVFLQNKIYYDVYSSITLNNLLDQVKYIFYLLNNKPNIETAFLIFDAYNISFSKYLVELAKAEKLLKKSGYEGVYQIASFHPQYVFEGSNDNDAANFTNRSPYAMFHFLREASVSKVVDNYKDISSITAHNIKFASEKGVLYFEQLLQNCKL